MPAILLHLGNGGISSTLHLRAMGQSYEGAKRDSLAVLPGSVLGQDANEEALWNFRALLHFGGIFDVVSKLLEPRPIPSFPCGSAKTVGVVEPCMLSRKHSSSSVIVTTIGHQEL